MRWSLVNTCTSENDDDNPDPELKLQCFGSGSGLELDSISSLDPFPDPDSESGTGSRGTKISHTNFSAIKPLIRIGIQPKTMDPDYQLSHSSYTGSNEKLCPPELEISSWRGRRLWARRDAGGQCLAGWCWRRSATAPVWRPSWPPGRVGKKPEFFFLNQPSGFFWVFWVFWSFFNIFSQKREFIGFFQFQEYF